MPNNKADGSIIIDTKLDNEGFEKGSDKLHNAVKSLTDNTQKALMDGTRSIQDYENAVKNFAKTCEKFDSAKNFEEASSVIDDLKNQLSEFSDSTFSLDGIAKVSGSATETFQLMKNAIDELEAALEKAHEVTDENVQSMTAYEIAVTRFALACNAFDSTGSVDEAMSLLMRMQSSLRSFADTMYMIDGIPTLGRDTESYRVMADALQQLLDVVNRPEWTAFQEKWKTMPRISEMVVNAFSRIRSVISSAAFTAGAAISTGITHPIQLLDRALGAAAILAGRAAFGLARLTGYGITSGLKKIADLAKKAAASLSRMISSSIQNGIKKLGSAMFGFGKNVGSANSGLAGGFKQLLQYGLGISSVFMLLNKLRGVVAEGIGNIAKYSGTFNSAISSFMSALAQLKNSFAAAFSPVLEVVLPILTTLTNALSEVISKIGMFVAALTGKRTYLKATSVQSDYAKSLGNTASNASSAGKAIDEESDAAKEAEKNIASFDDVEILRENKTADNNAGSGGGGGGAGGAGGFAETPIENSMAELADKFKDFIKNQDWEGLGKFLADGINSVFAKAKDLISWDNVGDKITKAVNAITRTINSLVENVDWALIGSTIGEGVNTIVNTLNLLLTGINWYNIGKALATGLGSLITSVNWENLGALLGNYVNTWIHGIQGFVENFPWIETGRSFARGINSAIHTIDWAGAGRTLSTGIIGALNMLSTAIQDVNWRELGEKVKEFLVNIDWNGVFDALCEAIGSALGGLAAFLWGLIGEAWQSVKDWWHDVAFEDGKFTIQGLLDGIIEKLKDIGNWIKKHIFEPIISGFKKAFGIESPSKEMMKMGGYIVDGLLKGITNGLSAIGNWIVNNIFTPIMDGIKKAFEIAGSIARKCIEIGSAIVSGFKEGITKTWNTITTAVSTGWETVKQLYSKVDWKNVGSTVVDYVKNGISGAWNNISTVVKTGWDTVKQLYSKVDWKSIGSAVVDNLKSGISVKWSNITQFVRDGWNTIKNLKDNVDWSSIGQSISNNIRNGIELKWYNITKFAQSGIRDLMLLFNDNWYSWSSIGQNICSGISNGISSGWSWLTSKVSSLASSLLRSAKYALRIYSPSKEFAWIGEMITKGWGQGIEQSQDYALDAVSDLAGEVIREAENADAVMQIDTAITDVTDQLDGVLATFSDRVINSFDVLISSMERIAEGVSFIIPAAASGSIVPYATAARGAQSSQDATEELVNAIDARVGRPLTRDDLASVLIPLLEKYTNISFYIGDEQIASHARAGSIKIDRRYNVIEQTG